MVVVQARHKKKPVKKTAKRSRASSDSPTLWQRHERDIWIVVMVVVGLFALLAEAGALGPVGHQVSRALALTFGVGRFAATWMVGSALPFSGASASGASAAPGGPAGGGAG